MFDFLFPKVPQVTVEEVKAAMDRNDDFILLDVRTPQEYAKGHLADSINISLDTLQNTVEKMFHDKNKTIYVYCLTGSRSIHAVAAISKLGYTNVSDMKSGLLAWRVKRYPELPKSPNR